MPAKEFDLSKEYKLVIYYGPFELLFSKEFILRVSDIFMHALFFTEYFGFTFEICLLLFCNSLDDHTTNKVSARPPFFD